MLGSYKYLTQPDCFCDVPEAVPDSCAPALTGRGIRKAEFERLAEFKMGISCWAIPRLDSTAPLPRVGIRPHLRRSFSGLNPSPLPLKLLAFGHVYTAL